MSEEIIIRNCSPTLAGMKTGNMFSCVFTDRRELCDSLRRWNRVLCKKGLRMIPLCMRGGRALIYLYRTSQLSKDLKNEQASRLLRDRGYVSHCPAGCIAHLMKRIGESTEFPHEVGLFLGYPPEDVCGFIEKGANGFKCSGCWKVYGDEESARRLFKKYKKCTDIYTVLHSKGKSVERLTVAG